MNTTSNVSLIAAGINDCRSGNAIVQGGIAMIAEGICEYWFTPLRWSYGKGDNEVSGVCNLGDMFKPRRHPDGSVDGKYLPAMYRAVAESFGVDGEMTNADKMDFQRAFTIAAARNAGAPVKFVDETVERKGKAVKVRAVQVPAATAFKLTDEEGAPTDIAKAAMAAQKSNLKLFNKPIPEDDKLLAMVQALPIECVGGKHAVFGKNHSSSDIAKVLRDVAVDAGLMPPPPSRNGSAKADKFGEALEYVGKCIELLDDDESDFAPSDAIEEKLRVLAERIAAYFAK